MSITLADELKSAIRDVPDFPKKGIIFKDITTLIQKPDLFKKVIDELTDRYKDKNIDIVAPIDARGFIFGGALAYRLGAGVVPVRKKGKLPYKTKSVTYDLEYGTDSLEMHEDAFPPGHNIVLVDDLLATGGTSGATARMIKGLGGNLIEVAFIIELTFLKGREKLKGFDVYSMIKY